MKKQREVFLFFFLISCCNSFCFSLYVFQEKDECLFVFLSCYDCYHHYYLRFFLFFPLLSPCGC